MVLVIILIGFIFIGVGFLVTKNNADTILAGYNTMSEEERKEVDLDAYLPVFKKFHIALGISFMVFGNVMVYVFQRYAGLFLALYPILAYAYFIFNTRKYSSPTYKNYHLFGVLFMLFIGALLVILAYFNQK